MRRIPTRSLLRVLITILTASVLEGCATGQSAASVYERHTLHNSNASSPGQTASTNRGQHGQSDTSTAHSIKTWSNGEQLIKLDKRHRRVTIHLNGIAELQSNRTMDLTWNKKRLQVAVPTGWSVQAAIPAKSVYRVHIVSTASQLKKDVSEAERTISGVRYGPTLHAGQPGTYNLLVRMPGQKGGHVLDLILVSNVDKPSVAVMND